MAVLAFVLVNIGDIHSHFCLDGQEPAVSLHFENLGGHPDHDVEDQEHNDFENEVTLKSLKTKTSDLSKLFVSIAEEGISFEITSSEIISHPLEEWLLPQRPASILPPLRAPPILIS